MLKNESTSSLAFPGASEATSLEQRGGSGSNSRQPMQRDIGFIGLGHMGTAMAANLAAAGRRVIAYVRRPDQMGKLVALGLNPTTDITSLFDCEIVISMLPDDDAVRDVVFGRADLGIDGLALGLTPGAIHLSMSTISTATASRLASEHAQSRARLRRCAGVRKSGCRQGASALRRRRGQRRRCRALPAGLRQSRTADIRRRDRSRTRKPRQAARQYDDRDHAGDARRSRCSGSQARARSQALHRLPDKHDVRRARA